MSETKALAIIQEFSVPALNEDLGQAFAEELDGLPMAPARVKIPSGGGLAFEVPGDDPDSPEMVKEIVGVIVDHYPVNAFWSDKYAGQNNPPDCSALDGKRGVTRDGEVRACNSCPYNAWGSGENGGKACKNMHRIYILREGEVLPLLLTLPPTSLKNFADYLARRIVGKGRRSYEVITKISLKKATSSQGITYSQAVFSLVGVLHQDVAQKMAEYSASIKAVTRNMAIEVDEAITVEANYEDEVEVM